jgi:hypothetical protein
VVLTIALLIPLVASVLLCLLPTACFLNSVVDRFVFNIFKIVYYDRIKIFFRLKIVLDRSYEDILAFKLRFLRGFLIKVGLR